MSDKKILVLDFSSYNFDNLLTRLTDQYGLENIKIIYSQENKANYYLQSSFKSSSLESYFSEDSDNQITKSVQNIFNQIYISLKDNFVFEKVDLCKILRLQLLRLFIELIKEIELIEKVIQTETLDHVVVLDDQNRLSKIACRLLSEKSLDFEIISAPSKKLPRFSDINIAKFLNLFSSFLQKFYEKFFVYFKKLPQPIKNKKNIIFFPETRTHIVSALPVIKELLKDNNFAVWVIEPSHKLVEKILKDNKIKYYVLSNFLNGPEKSYINKYYKIKNFYQRYETVLGDKSSIKYKNIPFSKFIQKELKFLFDQMLKNICYQIKMVQNVFARFYPDLVVVMTEELPLCKIVVNLANMSDIKSLYIQHGAFIKHPKHEAVASGKMAVAGSADKDFLINLDTDPDKLVITGRPLFDKLARKNEIFDKLDIRSKLKINPEKKIILFTTQPLVGLTPLYENITVFRQFLKAVKKLPDVQLIIKLHPLDDESERKKIITQEKFQGAVVTKDFNLHSLIYISDVLVTMFSTTALEAMIMKKPVITINFSGKRDVTDYAKDGAAIGVYKKEDLLPAIKSVLCDKETIEKIKKSQEDFVYRYAYLIDGKATKRIVDLIKEPVAEV